MAKQSRDEVTKERIYLYDTTLRDGVQSIGVQFRVNEKQELTRDMDAFGMDYIEGGVPGANDTDNEFFSNLPRTECASISAFGMTKRSGRSAENDINLANVLNADTESVCLVGKSHDFHVEKALGITLEQNLNNISDSISYLVQMGREAIFDAEHFFDGYKDNPEYALSCVQRAIDAGARWVVLCDTNGGTLPYEIGRTTEAVIRSGVDRFRVGIHTHNDTENAVACTLAAVDAGARQVQGTINGIGERCGNANLVSVIATLLLKEPYRSLYYTGVSTEKLKSLTGLSRRLDNILNREPKPDAAFVGTSAFAHKGGLHASGVLRDSSTYEHIRPAEVGNDSRVSISNQSGKANIRSWLASSGLELETVTEDVQARIVEEVKLNESRGYTYDVAQASFELLVRRLLGVLPDYFSVRRFRVLVENVRGRNRRFTESEAVVAIDIGNQRMISVSEGLTDEKDSGPVHALAKALKKDLGPLQDHIRDMELVDFKVRISGTGTSAVTRVIIDSKDSTGVHWSTVGVSANIIEASFEALIDSIVWKLNRENAKPIN